MKKVMMIMLGVTISMIGLWGGSFLIDNVSPAYELAAGITTATVSTSGLFVVMAGILDYK